MKSDYKREDFRIEIDLETGKRKYFVRIDKRKREFLEVSKKVYSVYYNSYKKAYRENKKESDVGGIISLSYTYDGGTVLIDRIASKESISHTEKIMLMDIMKSLTKSDCDFIIELVIMETSEEELAKRLNMTQSGVSKKKRRILKKLREMYG